MIKWVGHAWGAAVSSQSHLHSGVGCKRFLPGRLCLVRNNLALQHWCLGSKPATLPASLTSPWGPRAVSSPRRIPGSKGDIWPMSRGILIGPGILTTIPARCILSRSGGQSKSPLAVICPSPLLDKRLLHGFSALGRPLWPDISAMCQKGK